MILNKSLSTVHISCDEPICHCRFTTVTSTRSGQKYPKSSCENWAETDKKGGRYKERRGRGKARWEKGREIMGDKALRRRRPGTRSVHPSPVIVASPPSTPGESVASSYFTMFLCKRLHFFPHISFLKCLKLSFWEVKALFFMRTTIKMLVLR